MHKPLLTLIFILTLSLAGCYDAVEVDSLAHVLVIGIDQGVADKWRLTVQFPTMKEQTAGGASGTGMGGGKSSGGAGAEDQDGYTMATVDAPSFFTGINMINAAIPRRLSFMHTQFLVFSEEIARSGLIGEFLAPIVRYRQIRKTLHVVVSRTSAREFIRENKPFIGTTLSKSLEIIAEESDNTGFFIHATLFEFYKSIKSSYCQPIAILTSVNNFKNFQEDGIKQDRKFKTGGGYLSGELPRSGGNKVEFFGSAVFDGDKMAAELNGDETRMILIGKGAFKRGFFTIPDPKQPDLIVPLDVRQARKPEVKIRFDGERPVIRLKIRLESDILAVQSRINYENPKLKPVLEKAFEQYIENSLAKLFQKCAALRTDVFGYGKTAAMRFGTIQAWERYNWLKHFGGAAINSDVEFTIRRTGSQLRSSPIFSSEGKE